MIDTNPARTLDDLIQARGQKQAALVRQSRIVGLVSAFVAVAVVATGLLATRPESESSW